MDMNISIDIYIPKLLEWLTSRGHCKHSWQKEVVKIRNKINAAIKDMPQNDTIANLLSGSFLNYFHCLKIVEILKETEANSKNIFGMYSSKRMKDWKEIVSNYTKNDIYLAEAADLLINIVKYEVPSLKKQQTKQQQLQTEFKKKESDSLKSQATVKKELASFLKELGLEGTKGTGYRAELLASANGLSASHENIVSKTKSALPAIEHYKKFATYSQPNAKVDMGLIEYLSEKGNTTTYEWVFGEKPTKIIAPMTAMEEDASETVEDEIDWGSFDTNIEIQVVDSGDSEYGSGVKNEEAEEVNSNEKLAEGVNALSVLDNSMTRTKFHNQLLELKAFLKGRLIEADVENPLDVITESKSNIQDMLSAVESVLTILTDPTVQHQYNITHSPRYLEDILKKIQAKEDAIERFGMVASVSKDRSAEAAAEGVKLSKLIQVVVRKSKELENEIAADISNRYSKRRVNLVGGATV